MVQRTYGVMTNDTLLSVPLFVFMGYIMERAALVDRMFHSVQLAFRRVPASLAVTTLLVCAFWGIASGIVGAVVVLMGVIAMRPMLNAGYDVRLASGAITAGGTLGILIPPSVMLIVYAAVPGQSIVKLYAAAMLPGFFLTFLYLVYILGWAIINPKIAPKLPPDQYRVDGARSGSGASSAAGAAASPPVSSPRSCLAAAGLPRGRAPASYGAIVKNVLALLVPVAAHVRHVRRRPGGTSSSTTRRAAAAAAQRPRRPWAPQRPPTAHGGSPRADRHRRSPSTRRRRSSGAAETEVTGQRVAHGRADAPPEEMALGGHPADRRGRRAGSRRTSTSGSGGWPRSRRSCSWSTTGAWTASSSRS